MDSMSNKERYYTALVENRGRLNELEVGACIGLSDDETQVIIAQLLSEYKIKHVENRVCTYEPQRLKNR